MFLFWLCSRQSEYAVFWDKHKPSSRWSSDRREGHLEAPGMGRNISVAPSTHFGQVLPCDPLVLKLGAPVLAAAWLTPLLEGDREPLILSPVTQWHCRKVITEQWRGPQRFRFERYSGKFQTSLMTAGLSPVPRPDLCVPLRQLHVFGEEGAENVESVSPGGAVSSPA